MVNPDDLYAALVAAHEGLDAEASAALDARLILLLAEALDDPARVMALLDEARRLSA